MHLAIGLSLVLVLALSALMFWKPSVRDGVYVVTLAMAFVWLATQLFLGLKS